MRLPTRKQVKAAIKDYWKTAGKPKKQKGKKRGDNDNYKIRQRT